MRDYEFADLLEKVYGIKYKDLNVYQKLDLQEVLDKVYFEGKREGRNEKIDELKEELEEAEETISELEDRIDELETSNF